MALRYVTGGTVGIIIAASLADRSIEVDEEPRLAFQTDSTRRTAGAVGHGDGAGGTGGTVNVGGVVNTGETVDISGAGEAGRHAGKTLGDVEVIRVRDAAVANCGGVIIDRAVGAVGLDNEKVDT